MVTNSLRIVIVLSLLQQLPQPERQQRSNRGDKGRLSSASNREVKISRAT